jgi:hypothetical protein
LVLSSCCADIDREEKKLIKDMQKLAREVSAENRPKTHPE